MIVQGATKTPNEKEGYLVASCWLIKTASGYSLSLEKYFICEKKR